MQAQRMVNEATDDELVTRAQRGDRAAFGQLVHRYQHRIYALCTRWLAEPSVAEEVAQDTFLSAWRGLSGFRGEARFDTWLTRVAVNKCRNHRVYRQRRAHGRHDPLDGGHDDDGPMLQLVHGGPGTDASVSRTQAAALLDDALQALPEEHREVVLLRDLQDLTYDEIGDLLDIPRGTVKSRLHRARAALGDLLARHLGREDVF